MSSTLAVVEREPAAAIAGEIVPRTSPMASVPADRHPVAVYLGGLSPGARRTMRQALDRIAGLLSGGTQDANSLQWPSLRYQHTALIRSELAGMFAAATANKMLAALRGVLKECWRLGYIDAEAFQRAVDLKGVRGQTVPKGRALSVGEVTALALACHQDTGGTGRRDAALLALLWSTGMRRQEAVRLDLEDYNHQTGELKVHGKGNKTRLVYIANGAAMALQAWLAVRGSEAGPLLWATVKGGRLVARRLNDQAVYDILAKLAARAQVADFSPHDMRRTFASDLIDAGADLVVVQKLMGHANVTTTARYDRRGEAAKAKAAGMRHFPFQGAVGGSGAGQAGGKVA
jgi:site-specific recombinase XerD